MYTHFACVYAHTLLWGLVETVGCKGVSNLARALLSCSHLKCSQYTGCTANGSFVYFSCTHVFAFVYAHTLLRGLVETSVGQGGSDLAQCRWSRLWNLRGRTVCVDHKYDARRSFLHGGDAMCVQTRVRSLRQEYPKHDFPRAMRTRVYIKQA